jgi:hypothetical protein
MMASCPNKARPLCAATRLQGSTHTSPAKCLPETVSSGLCLSMHARNLEIRHPILTGASVWASAPCLP